MTLRTYSGPVTELPAGYSAYCIYIPTGMSEDFEKDISAKLQIWGDIMGKNLFVAPWNIGDPTYSEITKRIDFMHKPALILTDTNEINEKSFVLKLDDPLLVTDVARLTKLLPMLLDFIIRGDHKKAVKEAIEAKQSARIKAILEPIKSAIGKTKITFSWNGATISSQ